MKTILIVLLLTQSVQAEFYTILVDGRDEVSIDNTDDEAGALNLFNEWCQDLEPRPKYKGDRYCTGKLNGRKTNFELMKQD